ncbi:MAG: DUF934 domain-containing protein [Alphaproteobacteria bacterium]|nr:DUF934 domain-containing protein [Alphaproteobacteria bacterium]
MPAPTRAADDGSDTGEPIVSRNVLVRDTGFHDDDRSGDFTPWSGAIDLSTLTDGAALDVENAAPAEDIVPLFERIALIRIAFPSHMDGRGFSLARHLRLLGYRGRLRAAGRILADQYAMARRSGFDEVEIDPALAARQPEEQWLFRADWKSHDYQERLGRRRHNGGRGEPE